MEKEQGCSEAVISSTSVKTSSEDGAAVLQEVVQMTGLPEEYLNSEISELLGASHTPVNELTLDQLRSVLLNYLETVNEEMISTLEKH